MNESLVRIPLMLEFITKVSWKQFLQMKMHRNAQAKEEATFCLISKRKFRKVKITLNFYVRLHEISQELWPLRFTQLGGNTCKIVSAVGVLR